MSRPYNRVIEAVASLATKLGATVTNHGNRLADNLEGIAAVNIGVFPTAPTVNGSYVLVATKSATGVEYSWVEYTVQGSSSGNDSGT